GGGRGVRAAVKELLADLVCEARTPVQGRNIAREYLQARILQSMQAAGAMIPLAFHGGTALRFLFSLPRYSEELDFTLERPSQEYDLRGYLRRINRDLEAEGYAINARLSDRRIVHRA
ncbi:MAG TPA: nucleotidyl transferase AbiEii/AbiGii toxin family protein, partial [Chloroflexota bacterium]|nr:nucleotidyl transferase AbiEii/AbiGii toxin family protein [Chloroflexota bacterium]